MSNVNTADVLERETGVSIDSWYEKVEDNPHLSHIPLTRTQRCAHLPEMFRDLVTRLRDPLPLGTMALTSDAAHDHGCLRRDQGYTAAMMVEESRILQVSIFQTLKLYVERDAAPEDLLSDVMVIADEVDSQLAQAMMGYIAESDKDKKGDQVPPDEALVAG